MFRNGVLALNSFRNVSAFSSIPVFHDLPEAIKLVKVFANATYDETIEITIKTNVDPRKQNQTIRTVAMLPHGTGQSMQVAVFAQGDLAKQAIEAGADIVGAADLAQKIVDGEIDFNRCIASPDMMGVVGPLGRILGPRGLMPNPKNGSLTRDIAQAVKDAKQGQVPVKADSFGLIAGPVGKASFTHEKLEENIIAFIQTVKQSRPEGLSKRAKLFASSCLSSTQGKGIKLDIEGVPFIGR